MTDLANWAATTDGADAGRMVLGFLSAITVGLAVRLARSRRGFTAYPLLAGAVLTPAVVATLLDQQGWTWPLLGLLAGTTAALAITLTALVSSRRRQLRPAPARPVMAAPPAWPMHSPAVLGAHTAAALRHTPVRAGELR